MILTVTSQLATWRKNEPAGVHLDLRAMGEMSTREHAT